MEKIKQFLGSEQGKDVLVIFIVLLVGLGSFELGRLSKENGSPGVKIEYPTQTANVISAPELVKNEQIVPKTSNSSAKNFFASNRGKKYYPVGCAAGNTIKPENRVYFATSTEAITAGYELSSSCH